MLLHRQRATAFMRQCCVDALVATSPVNITYFSDYACWLDPLFKEYMMSPGASSSLAEAYAVLPLDGAPALVVNPNFLANASDLWVTDLYTFGDAGMDLARNAQVFGSPSEAVAAVLKSRGLSEARIGLEMDGMPAARQTNLLEALPGALLLDCTNLIRLVRAVKSPEELRRLTQAAEISERAGMEALAMARPGLPISEMIQRYRERVATLGAALDHFAFSPRGFGIAVEPEYVLRADDTLYMDFGCIFRHYFSDTGTTLTMRDLPKDLKARHDALRAAIEAGAEAMKPGLAASVVQRAMWQAFTSHGFQACFPHGHGLGLEVRDYPIIVPGNGLRIRDDCVDVSSDLSMEEGMVNNLEAGMFLPGIGSLQIEKSFLVTATGSRELIPQAHHQPCVVSS
jgi:Xaa-Pro dipeptidase